MKRILLIDPSIEIQKELGRAVENKFVLVSASTLAEGRSLLSKDPVDLVVLESAHPDGEGSRFCAEAKNNEATRDIPVIFLTGESAIEEKIKAFSMGADDYMIKPYEPLELVARIQARLKRYQSSQEEQSIEKGNLSLSIPFQKACIREGEVSRDLRLTPTEFRLLYFFIKNEGVILSREQLLSTIWSDDVHVLSRTIDKHISTLKKKLASCAEYLQSIHSQGYRFVVSHAQKKAPLSPSVVLGR